MSSIKPTMSYSFFVSLINVIEHCGRNPRVTKWRSSGHVLADKQALSASIDVGWKEGLPRLENTTYPYYTTTT